MLKAKYGKSLRDVTASAIEIIMESRGDDSGGYKSEHAQLRKAVFHKDIKLFIDIAENCHEKLHTDRNDQSLSYWSSYYLDANIILACLYCEICRFEEAIESLDRGLIVTSGQGRVGLIENIFQAITPMLPTTECSNDFDTNRVAMDLIYPVGRFATLDAFDFSEQISDRPHPIVISSAIAHWPALQRWTPSYLMSKSLGGRRLVPIEVGESYIHDDWAPQFISIKKFLSDYIFSPTPRAKIGYLAQFNLLEHIRSLQTDIIVPDYCYVDIPGHESLAKIWTNAWLGPAGTVSPIHRDPYHNILAQVIGYKYVRTYSPNQESKLYPPKPKDGLNMNNTSAVNVGTPDEENYPLFNSARYSEALLSPGDVIYIPKGWWHYVKSLSVSWSVSFWF